MKNYYSRLFVAAVLSGATTLAFAQKKVDSAAYYNQVKTYVNPVLPGDHPDPTLLKVGNDFYHCGSSFHFTPYLPIYHSKDLVHWEVISRVVMPENAAQVTDSPSKGIWQGAITYFYGSYWIYFSSNGQWFSKASSPKGPWSKPVKVETNPTTGSLGYDNSIFVDDDGKPYMVIKNGQKVNRLQELGKDGQLTSSVINLDWINAKLQYSWAEGPVMSKRNGIYYYFPAGDVSGGQYVLKATALTADSTKWTRLGNFFKPITDPKATFRVPNHIAAPLKLADGTWWTIAQSYQKLGSDDWSGMGRQTGLYPITWDGDRPWGMAPVSTPIDRPNLPQSGILWRSVSSDYFNSSELGMHWHFLSRKANASYSLTARKGWIRLTPDKERTHVMQKETDHYYTAVTKVDMNATDSLAKAGIYLTSGNQRVFVQLYSGMHQGNKQIVFKLDTAMRHVPNTFGNVVWLKVQRKAHELTAYCSGDGKKWVVVGKPISSVSLDKTQPGYNSWVGTSVGLFAEGKPADFDFFICKDGFTELPAQGYSNYFGVATLANKENAVTNTSNYGGWFMISGVDLGDVQGAAKVEVLASSAKAGKLQIWLDDLKEGKLIASVPVSKNDNWKGFTAALKGVKGHHDVFVKFPANAKGAINVKSIRFIK